LTGYRLPTTPAEAIEQQKEIAKKVVAKDVHGNIRLVCGVDVSYRQDVAHCSAVVTDMDQNVVKRVSTKSKVKHPYIPGLFILREAGPVLRTIRRLDYDLLLVNGHGQLHPRRCGLACYVGVVADKPAIGIAKRLLCGTVGGDDYVELDGQILGYRIAGRTDAYVSVGHKVSLETAITIAKSLTKKGEWLPEPLRLADTYSRL
jgi:deoxyribonuclease V